MIAAVLVALALGAAAASAGTVTGVSVTYQGREMTPGRTVGERVTVAFTLQSSLAQNQRITLNAPSGADLRGSRFQMNIASTGWNVFGATFSADGSTASLPVPAAIDVPAFTSVVISSPPVNPTRAGSYSWSVATPLDSVGVSAPVAIVPGPIDRLTVTDGGDQTVAIGDAFAPVTVRTTDAYGNAVAPAAPLDVTFETPASGASATLPGGARSAVVTSDAGGVAVSPVATATTVAGQFGMTASAPGLAAASAQLTNRAGAPTAIALELTSPLLAVGAFPATAQVTLSDVHGNAVGLDDLGGGEEPSLSATGGAQTFGLVWTGDLWEGPVAPAATVGRSLVRAELGALSAQQPFDTALAPLLGAPSATVAGATSATVAVSLDPRNAATAWRVEYGTISPGELASAPVEVARDAAAAEVSATLTGLEPATSYLYRFVAENPLGRRITATRTFKTADAPLPPVPTPPTPEPPAPGPPVPPAPPVPGGSGGGDGSGGGGDRGAPAGGPRLTRATLTPRAFRPLAGRRGGARLRFTLDRAVRVRLRIERRAGRRWRSVAAVGAVAGRRGANAVAVSGVAKGRRLAPGRYRLVLSPAGGGSVTVAFAIRR